MCWKASRKVGIDSAGWLHRSNAMCYDSVLLPTGYWFPFDPETRYRPRSPKERKSEFAVGIGIET